MVHHDLYARCETLEFLDKKRTETNFLGGSIFFLQKISAIEESFPFLLVNFFLHREGGGAQKGLLKLF